MPEPDSILSGLTTIANEWRMVAIGWHVFFGALLLPVLAGWRPSNRYAGYLLAAPLLSVSALAWASGNPFNGTIFSALAFLLLLAAHRFSNEPVRLSSSPFLVPGALLVAFGWSYPHFLKTDHWTAYAYAAPLGIVPCPTLSALIGVTLIFGLFRSRVWATTLAAAGLLYAAIGVFRLGVLLDYGLLAGATVLAAALRRSSITRRSVRVQGDERKQLPGIAQRVERRPSVDIGRLDRASAERKDAA
jgi:hypothetical protein